MVMPSIPAGHVPTAAELEQITDQIDSLTAPGWTAYTPSWSTSGVAPSIGNGSISGKYRRSASSDLIYAEFNWTAGSTTTFGTGFFFFSLPVTASATAYILGFGRLLDSGVIERPLSLRKNSTTTIIPISDAGAVSQNTPQVWANGDVIEMFLIYEPAA